MVLPSEAWVDIIDTMSSKPRSTRREFLSGRSAAGALAALGSDLADAVGSTPHPLPLPPASYVIELGRRAMACDFDVLLNAGEHARAEEHALQALDLVELLEAQLTVYRDTSEVSQLNQRAAEHPVVVESRLFQLLRLAQQLAEETGGAFDMTAGPLIRLWGFFRRAGRMPAEEEVAATLQRVGSRHLVLDDSRQTLTFARPGMEINLGAIGKGYALDRCSQALSAAGVSNYMMHGGQSSILARGNRSGELGWAVGLRHPSVPERRLGLLRLQDRALGTSGAANQFFYFQGKRYGHVIDPRNGWPADRLLAATVLAPSAAEADALATAFFVMGRPAVEAYCRSHPELGAILVEAGERAGELVITTLGLREGEWTEATGS